MSDQESEAQQTLARLQAAFAAGQLTQTEYEMRRAALIEELDRDDAGSPLPPLQPGAIKTPAWLDPSRLAAPPAGAAAVTVLDPPAPDRGRSDDLGALPQSSWDDELERMAANVERGRDPMAGIADPLQPPPGWAQGGPPNPWGQAPAPASPSPSAPGGPAAWGQPSPGAAWGQPAASPFPQGQGPSGSAHAGYGPQGPQPGAPWPGQPNPTGPAGAPAGLGQPPYGQPQQGQPPYGQQQHGQQQHGPAQHGQPPYGQPPYGQGPAGQAPPYGGQAPAYGQQPAQPWGQPVATAQAGWQPQQQPWAQPGQHQQMVPWQGQPGAPLPANQMPPTHLLSAALIMAFCFLPTGLVALFKGIQVQNAWNRGDVAGAQKASREASMWVNGTVIGSLFFFGAFFLLALLGGL